MRWISIAALIQAVVVVIYWLKFPYVAITPEIRDLALEMRKVVIELDGVLIGFAGLIGTIIFTSPIGKQDEKPMVLQTTLMLVLTSVGLFVVSIFLAIYSMSSVFLPSVPLADLSFALSTMILVCGVDALALLVVFEAL